MKMALTSLMGEKKLKTAKRSTRPGWQKTELKGQKNVYPHPLVIQSFHELRIFSIARRT